MPARGSQQGQVAGPPVGDPRASGSDSPLGEPSSDRSPLAERFDLRGRSLRQHTARGTLINTAFQVGYAVLSLIRPVAVAALLTLQEFGLWGILIVSFNTLLWLKQVGINDKYIQQSEPDQEAAFQKAFTLELLYTLGFLVLIALALPLFAALYGRPEILAPGFVMSLAVLATAFQAPTWVFYRRMEFVRQRLLESITPVVALVVTIVLAAVGAGYWSLVVGAVVGNVAAAIVAVRLSPYRLAFRFDRAAARRYVSFSWPLLVFTGSSLLVVQAAVIVGNSTIGLAGVAVIGLAGTVIGFADYVDRIVTRTLYPAICAVRDRTDLLLEAFTKSNRLALMWGVPFGLGLTLFAPDLVQYVLGSKWSPAIGVLQAFGAIVAINQIGFNWTAFMRARGDTRPLAVNGVLGMVAFLAVGVPLMIAQGLAGFTIGMAVVAAVQFLCRGWYLTRLFNGLSMARHAARALAPSVPAVAVVLLLRALGGQDAGIGYVLLELTLYVGVTAAVTAAIERSLLREVLGYLRSATRGPSPTPAG